MKGGSSICITAFVFLIFLCTFCQGTEDELELVRPPPPAPGDPSCPVKPLEKHDLGVLVNTGIKLKNQGELATSLSCFLDALRYDPHFGITYVNLAALYLTTRELDKARIALKKAISLKGSLKTGHAEIYLNLGNVEYEAGDYQASLQAFQQALSYNKNAYTYNLVCIAYYMLKQYQNSADACEEALKLEPNHSHALYNAGNAYRHLGDYHKALGYAERGTRLTPADALHYNSLGSILHDMGHLDKAVTAYKEGLKINPAFADSHSNLGNLLSDMRRYEESLEHHLKAAELGPRDPRYLNNLGLIYRRLSRISDSIKAYKRATIAAPGMPDPWYNMANMYKEEKRYKEALKAYRQASRLNPTNTNYKSGIAGVYFDQGKFDKAIKAYEEALQLESESPDILYNYANALKEVGKYRKAIRQYEKALNVMNLPTLGKPHDWVKKIDELKPKTFYDLFYAKSFICEWGGREQDMKELQRLMASQLADNVLPNVLPFQGISYPLSGETLLQLSRKHAENEGRFMKAHFKHDNVPRLKHVSAPTAQGKLRIGYVSADFRDHPVAEDMLSVYRFHNRSRFEVICFAITADDGSEFRKSIRSYADRFLDLSGQTDLENAKAIEAEGIHILIDLTGYTRQHRLGIFAARPAPIQILYKGFSGTSGAEYIDYVIGDRIVTPVHMYSRHFSEKAIVMPHQFFVNDFRANSQHVLDLSLRPSKAAHSIPEDKFLFCNFNKMFKIEPHVFGVWVDILKRVPNSVLWLLAFPEEGVHSLGRALRSAGVSPDRLFVTHLFKKEEHLLIKSHCDVFLDTMEYNAHGTAAEALWAGIPVLTKPGPRMTARVAASLVAAAGIPEMVVPSDEEYIQRAVHLATHPDDLQAITRQLREQRTKSPLFDVPRWLQNYEAGLQMAWELHATRRDPAALLVSEQDSSHLPPSAAMYADADASSSRGAAPIRSIVENKPSTHSTNDFRTSTPPTTMDQRPRSQDGAGDTARNGGGGQHTPPPPPSSHTSTAQQGNIKRIFVPMDKKLYNY